MKKIVILLLSVMTISVSAQTAFLGADINFLGGSNKIVFGDNTTSQPLTMALEATISGNWFVSSNLAVGLGLTLGYGTTFMSYVGKDPLMGQTLTYGVTPALHYFIPMLDGKVRWSMNLQIPVMMGGLYADVASFSGTNLVIKNEKQSDLLIIAPGLQLFSFDFFVTEHLALNASLGTFFYTFTKQTDLNGEGSDDDFINTISVFGFTTDASLGLRWFFGDMNPKRASNRKK